MDHLCLEIGPITRQEMEAHLKKHGLAIEEQGLRGGAKGEGYSWYIRDPWDHQIELKTDRESLTSRVSLSGIHVCKQTAPKLAH